MKALDNWTITAKGNEVELESENEDIRVFQFLNDTIAVTASLMAIDIIVDNFRESYRNL